MKTLILDFVGVIADLNKRKLVNDLTLKQKFSALRIYASQKKYPDIKLFFNAYQKGFLEMPELEYEIKKILPNSAYVVPYALSGLQQSIEVNNVVLNLVQIIRQAGVKVIVMSNSTPETEYVMKKCNLNEYFDGIILSTVIGSIKPEEKIYEYAITKFNIDSENTYMIDDTKKNLETARKFGILTERCKNTKDTIECLYEYIKQIKNDYQLERKIK